MKAKMPSVENPTKATLYLFLAAIVGAFIAGAITLLWMQKQVSSLVKTEIKLLNDDGKLPQGPQGLPGPAGVAIPIGSIVPFFGGRNEKPEGFLICEGSPIRQSEHPKLYSLLLAVTPDRSKTKGLIELPDLSSKFLRGDRAGDQVGSTGGKASHDHKITVGGSSSVFSKPPGHRNDAKFPVSGVHIHSASSDSVPNLPPYENVL